MAAHPADDRPPRHAELGSDVGLRQAALEVEIDEDLADRAAMRDRDALLVRGEDRCSVGHGAMLHNWRNASSRKFQGEVVLTVLPRRTATGTAAPFAVALSRLAAMDDLERKRRLAFALFWAMLQRDMTAPVLGERVGKSPNTIRRWAEGDTTPSALDIAPLAAALGVEPGYFIDPPAVPDYPFERFAIAGWFDEAIASGRAEGLRRSREPRGRGTQPRSPRRPPRAAGAGQG